MPMRPVRRLSVLLSALLMAIVSARAEPAASVVTVTTTARDYGGGRIYLPVRFGNVMGTMRLDTGASTSRIALAPWNRDLPSVGRSLSTGASGAATLCEDVLARNVAIKATLGNDIARATYEVSRCAASDGDDLLGLDFFKGARFALDIERRQMTFFGDPPAPGRARPFQLLGPERKLVGIDLRLGGVAVSGLFDTGAEICAVDRRFVEKHKNLFAPVKRRHEASEAGGRRFPSSVYKIKTLDLGEGRVLRDVYALVYDFGVLRDALGPRAPLILGYNFLSRFDWNLDFRSADAPTWDARPK